jgi:hypothetical protein
MQVYHKVTNFLGTEKTADRFYTVQEENSCDLITVRIIVNGKYTKERYSALVNFEIFPEFFQRDNPLGRSVYTTHAGDFPAAALSFFVRHLSPSESHLLWDRRSACFSVHTIHVHGEISTFYGNE